MNDFSVLNSIILKNIISIICVSLIEITSIYNINYSTENTIYFPFQYLYENINNCLGNSY